MSNNKSVPNKKIQKGEVKVLSPNLLPLGYRQKQDIQTLIETIGRVGKIGIICAVIFLGAEGFIMFRIFQKESEISKKLEQEVEAENLKQLEQMKREVNDLNSLSGEIRGALYKEYHWSNFLGKMPEIVPENVVITNWLTTPEKPGWVTMRGVALQRDGFLKLKENLENSEHVEKMESPLSNYVTPEKLEFELNVFLKDWKGAKKK